jgi:Outer membrane protein beta-barrel domain
MKPITILLLSAISLKTHAQWSIMPSVTYAKTAIYNKEEHNPLHPMPPTATYMPQFCASASKIFKRARLVTQSLNFGLGLQTYKQMYSGMKTDFGPAIAQRSLSYISCPVLYEFQCTKHSKLKPFVQLGLRFEMLQKYNILYRASYLKDPIEDNWLYTVGANNINVSLKSPSETQVDKTTVTSSKWFYKRLNMCSQINIGAAYNINTKLNLRAQLDYSFGLMDVENKKVMQFTKTSGYGDGLIIDFSNQASYDPWHRYSNFIGNRPSNFIRPATYTRSLGLALAMSYTL